MSAAVPAVPEPAGTPVPAPVPPPASGPSGGPVDWTDSVSIVQPRQAAFWLFLVMLAIGGASFVDEQLAFADASTTAWLVGLVLLAVYAVPVFLLVRMLDLFEREPTSLLVGALLWGAIVATFLAGRVNTDWDGIVQKLFGAAFAREWGAAIIAPAVEELVKFLGVVVIYLIARREFDDVMDGFVYGAMVGLGFTLSEDMYYFFTHFVGQAGASDLGGLFEGFFMRIIVGGPYSHVLLTGLTGMGLAWYVTRPEIAKGRRVLALVLLYAAGVAAHFVWNSPLLDGLLGDRPDELTWITWAAVKGLPFLVLLGVLVAVEMRREHRWVKERLAGEVAAGVVTEEELEVIGDLRLRRDARRAVAVRKGAAGERLMARLQHAQVELAMAASRTAPDREPRLVAQRALIVDLRAQLTALPDAGQPAGAAGGGGAWPAPGGPGAAFAPSHTVPIEGLPAWPAPDGNLPATGLAGSLPLEVVQRVGDWAQVRASNGWTGWVDARRLLPR